MTAIVKGMQPSDKTGHIAMYKDFSISSLPEAPTAAGFRPGACDTLACAIPAEIMVHTTGHDLIWSVFDPGPNPHRGPRTRLMF